MAKIPYSPNMYANNNPAKALQTRIEQAARMYGAKGAAFLVKTAQCFGQFATKKKTNKKNRQQRIAARALKAAKAAKKAGA